MSMETKRPGAEATTSEAVGRSGLLARLALCAGSTPAVSNRCGTFAGSRTELCASGRMVVDPLPRTSRAMVQASVSRLLGPIPRPESRRAIMSTKTQSVGRRYRAWWRANRGNVMEVLTFALLVVTFAVAFCLEKI